MKFNRIYTLVCLLLFLAIPLTLACKQPVAAPSLPAPSLQPILPSNATVLQLKTVITDGPEGTVASNNMTFTWASSLSSVDPSTITYATFLQGYDQDYTPFLNDTTRTFSGLPPGNYIFYVKAQDSSGNIEPEPASRSVTIADVAPVQPEPVIVSGSGGLILAGGDINRIVVAGDGATLYALSSAMGRLYRSDSNGAGWSDISSRVGGGAPWVDIAIAPDNPLMIAVATDSGKEIYISADAGATFNPTGLSSAIGAGRAVRCISISPDYGSPKREIAAGIWSGTAGGTVMINILSGFPSGWFDTGAGGIDVFAVKYSNSFAADGTLLAIASTSTQTLLYMGVRDLGSNTTTWNTTAGYPVELGQPSSGSSGTPLNYADIALPSDFNGNSPYSRHIIASWSRTHASQDVYHVYGTQVYRMHAPEPIASVAYYGSSRSGKLLLGAARCISSGGGCYQVQTYFSASPLSGMPNAPAWQPSQKAPTGSRDARVAWSSNGNTAFAATSGTQAAVSHSINDGYTWNQ